MAKNTENTEGVKSPDTVETSVDVVYDAAENAAGESADDVKTADAPIEDAPIEDAVIDRAIDKAIKETPKGESKSAAIIANIKAETAKAKDYLKSLTAADSSSDEVEDETGEVAAFFKNNPDAKSVLQVGETLFLSHSIGGAHEFAKRNGLKVESIPNPNLTDK